MPSPGNLNDQVQHLLIGHPLPGSKAPIPRLLHECGILRLVQTFRHQAGKCRAPRLHANMRIAFLHVPGDV